VERQEPIWRVAAKSLNEAGRVATVGCGDGVLPGGCAAGTATPLRTAPRSDLPVQVAFSSCVERDG